MPSPQYVSFVQEQIHQKTADQTAVYNDLSEGYGGYPGSGYEIKTVRHLLAKSGKVKPRVGSTELEDTTNRDLEIYRDRIENKMSFADMVDKYGLTRPTMQGIISRVKKSGVPDEDANNFLSSNWGLTR